MSLYQSHYCNRNHTILIQFFNVRDEDRKSLLPYFLQGNDFLAEDIDLNLVDNGIVQLDPLFPNTATIINITPSETSEDCFFIEGTRTDRNGLRKDVKNIVGTFNRHESSSYIQLGYLNGEELGDISTLLWTIEENETKKTLSFKYEINFLPQKTKEYEVPRDFDIKKNPTQYLKIPKVKVKEIKKGSGISANN